MRTLLALILAAVPVVVFAQPEVSVRSTDGRYVVVARFETDAPAAIVREVLTDYEAIPRFMPDVRHSEVRERDGQRVLVEQEAVSKFMLFRKTVHLVLEVTEGERVLAFRDLSGKSFESYEGAWTLESDGARTLVSYTLSAEPRFDVPGFVLKRVLGANARETIDHLRAEAALRAARIR